MLDVNYSDLSRIHETIGGVVSLSHLKRICSLLEDDLSRQTYIGNLYLTYGGDGDYTNLRSDYPAYFHREVVAALKKKTGFIFVNAGAAGNGEMNNVQRLGLAEHLGKGLLFEPDSDEMNHLRAHGFSPLVVDKLIFESLALGNHNGTVAFTPGVVFEKSGKIGGKGQIQIPSRRLDDYIVANNVGGVDFLKMDVEGFESQLLEGAVESIKRYRPILAISIYHSLDDYVNLPLYVQDTFGYSTYFIGYHPNIDQLKVINRDRKLSEIILYCLP